MNRQVLFIHGGGEGGYGADVKLARSLQARLGSTYEVHHPEIIFDESLPDFGWLAEMGKHIDGIKGEVILVGHSFGSSMLLKYLSENRVEKQINGLFLIAPPFWSGDEDWKQGIKLRKDFGAVLPKDIPVFLYYCLDDEEVPLSHFLTYKQNLPQATVREQATGGHQFNDDLTIVAKDIMDL